MQNNNVILQECNPEAAAKNKIHDLKDFDQFISSLRVEKKLCDNNSSISKTKKGINFQTTFKDFLVEFFYRRQRGSQNRVRQSIQSQGGLNVSTIQSCETVYARRIYDGLEDTTLYKIQCFFMRTDQPFVGISITDAIQQNQNSNINNDSILLTRNKQVSVFSCNGGGSGGGGSVNETKTNCLNYIHYTVDKLNKVIQMMVQEKMMEEHKLAGYEYLNSNTLQNITNITEIGNQLQSILIYCSSPSSGHIAQKKEYLNIIEYLKNIFFCMRQHVFILNNFDSIEDYQVYTDPYLLKFILYSIVLNIYSNLNQQRQSFSTQNQESSTQINNTNQELKKITIEYSVNEDMSKIRIGSPIRLTGDLLFGKLNNNIEFNGIEKSVIQDVAVIIQGKREIVTEQVEDQKLQRLFNRNLEINQSDIGATVYILELPNHLNLMKKNESFLHQNRKNIDHSLLDSANLQDYNTTKPFFQMQPCQQNVQKKLLFNRTSKRYVENLERLITPECYRGKVGSKCNQSFSIESKKLGDTLSVSQSRQDRQTQDYNLSLKQLTSTRFHQDELTNQANSQKIQTTSNRLISLLKPTTVGSSDNLEMDNSDDQEYSNINKVYNFEEKKKEIQIM